MVNIVLFISRRSIYYTYDLTNYILLLAIIPIKTAGVSTGSLLVEFSGSLQDNIRIYFGPVNLSRINIQLVTDKGDSVDLNGSDWSCTIQCDQLYQNKNI